MSIWQKIQESFREAMQAWRDRQVSTLEDRIEKRLEKWGIPYERNEPDDPEESTEPPPQGDIPGTRRTKVKGWSENDGKLVVLWSAEYRWGDRNHENKLHDPHADHPKAKVMDRVWISSGPHQGEQARVTYWPEGRNGNRIHSRFAGRGDEYGGEDHKYTITVRLESGDTETFWVKDSRKKYNVI